VRKRELAVPLIVADERVESCGGRRVAAGNDVLREVFSCNAALHARAQE
jgi:hypothetical protein